jgi:hypothetical protein
MLPYQTNQTDMFVLGFSYVKGDCFEKDFGFIFYCCPVGHHCGGYYTIAWR